MALQTDGTGRRPAPGAPSVADRSTLPVPGWYPDPAEHAALRYWGGDAWTSWVSDGTGVRPDPSGLHRRLDPGDLPHLDFVEQVFLVDARARGCLTPSEDAVLADLVASMRTAALRPATIPAPTIPPARRAIPAASRRPGLPPGSYRYVSAPVLTPAPEAAPSRPRSPSPLSQWWARTRTAVGSDLALHGLAYLGVLLFFVGAFGLVVFAFGDVAPALRPVAEAVIALAPFGAAALLLRRGATVVGRALEVVGGLLLPVMLITTFVDGHPVPPDLEGPPLVLALTAVTSLVALGYALWSRRHPDSALRYLVAPTAWLAVAMSTLGLGAREIPGGRAVATPSAVQVAVTTMALVVGLVWARLRPTHRLAGPTTAVSLPGVVVLGSLGVLTWLAEGWPFVPVLLTGLLVLVVLELLDVRVPATALAVVEPLWWALVTFGLAAGAGDIGLAGGAVAALSAAGFLALLEVAAAARRPALALVLPALGLTVALGATTADPWWAVTALGAASLWAATRRTAPFAVRGAAAVLDVATVVLPAIALANLADAAGVPASLLTGGALTAVAAVLARRHLLVRSTEDRFWSTWWALATAVTLVSTLGVLVGTPARTDGERWALVAALATLTLAGAVAPLQARWRPPVLTGLAAVTWVAAAGVLELSVLAVTTPIALTALGSVLAAHALPARPSASPASLGLTGHVAGSLTAAAALVSLATASPGWAPGVTVGLAAAGWWVTGWRDAQGRSDVGTALARVGRWLAWLPLTLATGGTLLTASLLLDHAGLLPYDDPWSVIVPVAAAVTYAAASRLPLPLRVGTASAWAGFLSGLLAATWATTRPTLAVGLASIPAAVLLTSPERRTRVMTWTAWLAPAPALGLLAAETWPWFGSLPAGTAAALTLVSVGSLLRVGGAAADLRGRSWTPALLPTHPWALPPIVVGATELALGFLTALAFVAGDPAGWIVAGVAVALAATALLTRAGIVAGGSALVGWVSVLMLAGPTLEAQPWVAVAAVLVLLLAAEGLSRLRAVPVWWARWDVPVLVAAAPVAVSALVLASGSAHAAATSAAVGAECLAVASRLRRHRPVASALGIVGALLVVTGAASAGHGWLALALLGLSAVLTRLAVGAAGATRAVLQVAGAVTAVGAWLAGAAWLELSGQVAVELTALAAGATAGIATVATFRTRVDRSWVLVWGGVAVIVEAVCAWDVLGQGVGLRSAAEPSWAVAVGLALTAASLAIAAGAVALRWLRDLAVAFGLLTLLVVMDTVGASVASRVVLLSLVSVASAVATLTVATRTDASRWLRPLVEVGVASTLWALIATVAAAADPMLLAEVLAAAAVQAVAVGVALRCTLLQMAAPVLACAAWLVFSHEALDANPQWVTVPIGLAVLVVVALWRRDRIGRGLAPAAPEVVGLELVGIAFLAGASVVQSVTESVAYAGLTAVVGVAVAAWGVVSRVRRRLAAGLGLVVIAVVLFVGIQLVRILPSWEGAGLWVLIGGVGLAVILVAVLLERGKAAVRSGLVRFTDATAGWE